MNSLNTGKYKFRILFLISVIWSFRPDLAFAQEDGSIETETVYEINFISGTTSIFEKIFEEALEAKDSLSFSSAVQLGVSALWADGYITANLDSIYRSGNTITADVYSGLPVRFDEVAVSPEEMAIVHAAGLKNLKWSDKTVSREFISEYTEELLTYMENNGYPFAKVSLDSTSFEESGVSASLNLQKNSYVPFDSLKIVGSINLRRSFLDRYLNIRVNDPYSRKKINKIPKRIQDLSFIELDSTPIIKFANDFAEVQLFLKAKKASRFDFIIGVLPSNATGERKFQITGDFTAEMHNRLGQGEYIFANVQSRPETKVLDLRFKYPYLLDLPLGIDTKFGIFFNEKFRETNGDLGILYQFDGAATLKASWNRKSSRLIEVDTAAILSSGKLPNQLDLTYNGGGLEYSASALDYLFNPSKGWDVQVGGTIGIKRIIQNNRIEALSRPGLDFSAAYDSLKINTLQTEVNISGALYIPAFRVGTFKIGLQGGLQYNEEQIYENELYRIGGNKLLRGFDEQSILADIYLVNTLEFRLLLDRNSYLSFPFVDYGLTKIRIDGEPEWDQTISFGIGINFATPAGIFNVSFAAGKRLDNPLDFGNTKIHFGYVSLF